MKNVPPERENVSHVGLSDRNVRRGRPTDPPNAMDAFVRRQVGLAALLLILLLAAVALSGILLRHEMKAVAGGIYDALGFGGLALALFVADTFVSPVPTDLILWIVASSELSARWYAPVTILALLSTLGGHVGWWLGWRLAETGLVRRMVGRYHGRSLEVMRRHGMWAVVLAAVTPLPWSLASWTAGALHMPWRSYLLGSLARFPRLILYYIFIHLAFHGTLAAAG